MVCGKCTKILKIQIRSKLNVMYMQCVYIMLQATFECRIKRQYCIFGKLEYINTLIIDPLEFIAREKGKPYILVLYSVASEIIVFEAHKWTIRPSCLAF